MKVLSKLLGAILLLGCLAYISFVFGKYVLSSSLLKSIPRTDQVISSTPVPPSSAQDTENSNDSPNSPRVEMRVMPSSPRTNRSDDTGTNMGTNTPDQAKTDSTDSNDVKKFDEGDEDYSSRHRHHRRKRHQESTDSSDAATAGSTSNNSNTDSADINNESTSGHSDSKRHRSSVSSSAPVRHLNRSENQSDKSPVPQPEKSNSSGGSDAGNISPVPKPE